VGVLFLSPSFPPSRLAIRRMRFDNELERGERCSAFFFFLPLLTSMYQVGDDGDCLREDEEVESTPLTLSSFPSLLRWPRPDFRDDPERWKGEQNDDRGLPFSPLFSLFSPFSSPILPRGGTQSLRDVDDAVTSNRHDECIAFLPLLSPSHAPERHEVRNYQGAPDRIGGHPVFGPPLFFSPFSLFPSPSA